MKKRFSLEKSRLLLNMLLWSSMALSIASIATRDIVLSEAGFRTFIVLFVLERLLENPEKLSKMVFTVLVLLLTPSLVVLNPAIASLAIFTSSVVLALNELAHSSLSPGVLVIVTWFTIQVSFVLIKSGGGAEVFVALGAGFSALIASSLLYTWYRRALKYTKTKHREA